MFRNCKIAGVGINSETYHKQEAKRCTPEFIMSPSSLKAFMECASRYKAGYQPPDTEAKDWGSLLDTLLLTPKQFEARYSIKPATYPDSKTGEAKPWNGNATFCKEWIAEQADRQIVSGSDVFEAHQAIRRLMADETIAAFHDASEKQVHITGEWYDKATGLVIPVQCLIDYVPKGDSEFQKSLGDLKSTRNAGLRPFQRWCYSAQYHTQGAFDLDLFDMATRKDENDKYSGQGRDGWIFIVQENYPPYEVGRRLLSQEFVQIGRQTYQHALQRYARCLKTGIWSGYDAEEEFSLISPEPWQEFDALSDTMRRSQEEAHQDDDIVP